MWIPATWIWRAALTCVLLETVLRGVRGRRKLGAFTAKAVLEPHASWNKNSTHVQTLGARWHRVPSAGCEVESCWCCSTISCVDWADHPRFIHGVQAFSFYSLQLHLTAYFRQSLCTFKFKWRIFSGWNATGHDQFVRCKHDSFTDNTWKPQESSNTGPLIWQTLCWMRPQSQC